MKRNVLGICLCTILVVSVCSSIVDASILTPWQLLEDSPVPVERGGFGGAALNGYVYSIGGCASGCSPADAQSLVHRYDPASDAWEQVASMNTARHSLGAVALDGYIYAIGGHVANSRSENERYDPSGNTWTTLASKPTAVSDFGIAAWGGEVYCFGGNRSASIQSVIEVYNPSAGWRSPGNMPAAGLDMAAAALGEYIYQAGGYDVSTATALDHLWAYDPVGQTWDTALPSMNVARANHELAVVGNYLFAIGGWNETDGQLSSVEWWTPGASEWVFDESLNIPRHGFASGVIGNSIYAFGGSAQSPITSMESTTVIPEPCSLLLVGAGAGLVGLLRRRRPIRPI